MAEATLREGEEKGMNKLLMLIQRLLSDGRSNDIERFSSDAAYCKKLLVEYGIA